MDVVIVHTGVVQVAELHAVGEVLRVAVRVVDVQKRLVHDGLIHVLANGGALWCRTDAEAEAFQAQVVVETDEFACP